MNYTSKQHQLTSTAYEGYGVYEFNVPGHLYTPPGGMGQIPGLPNMPALPSSADAITTQGGLQVVKAEFREAAIGALNQTVLKPDQADINASLITGQASIVLGSVGSGWASDYLAKGYAILAEIATIDGGTPNMLLTKNANAITANAGVGAGYVVVAGPGALLGAAMGPGPSPAPGTEPVPGPLPGPLPAPSPSNGGAVVTAPAATTTPTWVWPAVIGVGALAAIAVAMSMKK